MYCQFTAIKSRSPIQFGLEFGNQLPTSPGMENLRPFQSKRSRKWGSMKPGPVIDRPHHRNLKKLFLVAVVGFFAGACSGSTSIHPSPERDSAGSEDAVEHSCKTQKIRFTQQTGCANDGSFEFCLPVGDSVAKEKILKIDRSISCELGPGGRAECHRESQQLCTFRIPVGQCTNWKSPLPEEVWKIVCQLAELEAVPMIVHTVLE